MSQLIPLRQYLEGLYDHFEKALDEPPFVDFSYPIQSAATTSSKSDNPADSSKITPRASQPIPSTVLAQLNGRMWETRVTFMNTASGMTPDQRGVIARANIHDMGTILIFYGSTVRHAFGTAREDRCVIA